MSEELTYTEETLVEDMEYYIRQEGIVAMLELLKMAIEKANS